MIKNKAREANDALYVGNEQELQKATLRDPRK